MERATLATCWTAGGPVGPRCIAFLRRVRGRDAYTLIRNADLEAVVKALAAGFLAWVGPSRDDVRLTERGAAYLDRLARVE
ncbi:hypothetical protein CN138_31745 [Sinorhizobium meliloti]|uniref:hypothetical protein n=1 Tax=Rhizobium meliloti TaxID=382 RepID=UPI0001E4B5D8|nr:hypothetical protein [Sinorhizobium meliloti]AEG53587.1 hypothetical protein Sinme_1860 [Sinorhizobium meliloti AK83]MDE4590691.1 hypothetical protein [Sinorhizobium meliloti]QGJ74518.1 hypothetical protein C3L21_11270 [Sinorhizobium meliloti]RVL63442.1 hypothetical protein CN138_31745 [Sinorhizobium meliloti]WQO40227.1 hypothetical protein U8C34_26585 [Sinorhizobium meliloti]